MKSLHLLFAAKMLAIIGLGGVLYAKHQARAQDSNESSPATGPKAESSDSKLPDIPEKGLSLSRAAEIRNQLLLMRKDVEQKIEKLNAAQKGYERSKGDVEAKLKRIEEERRLLEETLQKERKAKDERLSETLEFVAKMEPKKAAPLIETMDRDLVMQLLRKLPPRQVTKLLESVNPKKATEILEYYTRIRSGREYELLREMGLCATDTEEGKNDKSKTDKSGPMGQTTPSESIPVAAADGSTAAKSTVAGGTESTPASKEASSTGTPAPAPAPGVVR